MRPAHLPLLKAGLFHLRLTAPAFLRPVFPFTNCLFKPSILQAHLVRLPHQGFPTSPIFICTPFFLHTPYSFLLTKCTSTNHPPNMAVPYLPPPRGAYPTRKHTTSLLTAGLPRSPHKCASLAVTVLMDNIRPFTALSPSCPSGTSPLVARTARTLKGGKFEIDRDGLKGS